MNKEIKILVLGDFFSSTPNEIQADDSFLSLLHEYDLKCCTFEGPVESQGKSIIKSGPTISQSVNSPTFLEQYGFNVISLANNHIMDYGKTGLDETISSFQNTILVGAGEYSEAYKVKNVKLNGYRIGFLALAHHEFGMSTSFNMECGAAWINDPCVDQVIIESKKELDFLFVLPHAGIEHLNIPLPEWRKRYKRFIELGADAVIASHPHVPQGWEIFNGHPIFYSLGNFYFDRAKDNDALANLALYVDMRISEEGILSFSCGCLERNGLILRVANNTKNEDWIKNLALLLQNDEKYNELLDKEMLYLWEKNYKLFYYYGLNKLSLKYGFSIFIKTVYKKMFNQINYPLLINNMRCESHCWAITRAMELLIYKKRKLPNSDF